MTDWAMWGVIVAIFSVCLAVIGIYQVQNAKKPLIVVERASGSMLKVKNISSVPSIRISIFDDRLSDKLVDDEISGLAAGGSIDVPLNSNGLDRTSAHPDIRVRVVFHSDSMKKYEKRYDVNMKRRKNRFEIIQ